MSNAHKGSRLILKDVLIPVDFSSAHFDYNVDTTGIQYGNLIEPVAGSVYTMRPNEGKFGGGIAIEEGATNLVLNPYFDANWGNSAYATKTLIDAPFIDGSTVKALKLVYSGSGDGYASRTIALPSTPNRTFTFSFWVKQVGNNVGLWGGTFLQFNKAAGYATVCNYSPSTVPTEWTRITITGTTPSDTTSNFNIILRPLSSATGEIWYTLPQIEEKPFATSFTSGTRASGKLIYKTELTPKEGTIHVVFKSSQKSFASLLRVVSVGTLGTGNTNPRILICQTSSTVTSSYFNADGIRYDFNFPTFIDGNWHTATVTWKSGVGIKSFFDGVKTLDTSFTTAYQIFDTDLSFGAETTGTDANHIVDETFFGNKYYTDDEIIAMHVSNKPFYNPYDYRSFSY